MIWQVIVTLLVGSQFAIAPASSQTPSPFTPSPAAPSPSTMVPLDNLKCNICGPGNSLGAPSAIITFTDHALEQLSMPCSDLQAMANANNSRFPADFCDDLQGFAVGVCQCKNATGTMLTAVPTLAPSPRQTTLSPSFPPGAIPLTPSHSPVVAKPSLAPGSPCVLCGSGNTIGSPDESFTFKDTSGNSKTLGCQQAQDLLDNSSNGSVPVDWCESVQAAAIVPCACTLPDGAPVQGGDGPTVSPNNRKCWICGTTDGEANIMGDGNAVVNYLDSENVTRKFPCKELARLADDTIAIPLWYCDQTVAQAVFPCRCASPEGDLLSDMYPTFSPVNGGKPATPVYQRDDDNEGGEPTNESPSSGPNDDNGNSTGGNGNSAAFAWNKVKSAIIFGMATLLALGL